MGQVENERCFLRVLPYTTRDGSPKHSWFNMSRKIQGKASIMHASGELLVVDAQVICKLRIADGFLFTMDMKSNSSRTIKVCIGSLSFECTQDFQRELAIHLFDNIKDNEPLIKLHQVSNVVGQTHLSSTSQSMMRVWPKGLVFS